jgi:hypothetical protein
MLQPRFQEGYVPASYIVRIYQRDEKGDSRTIAGVVEEAGSEKKKSFRSYDELWEILNSSNRKEKEK